MNTTTPPEVLTVAEVAELFRIGRQQVYSAVQEKTLRSARFGNSIRIRRADAEAWFNTRMEEER